MAYRAETINPRIQPAPQEMQDKHYYRKHGDKCLLRTELKKSKKIRKVSSTNCRAHSPQVDDTF